MKNESTSLTNAEPKPVHAAEPPPLADVVGRLSSDLRLLAKQEAELAKHEIGDRLNEAKRQAIPLTLGAVALIGGGLALLAAAVLALGLVLPVWLAALLIGAVMVVAGAASVWSGKTKLAHVNFKPEATLESVRRDVNAIKRGAA
jgi:hypothetical protein